MASLGHIAVGMAAGRAYGTTPRWRSMVALSAISALPDIDVIGFRFGINYGDPFGHRGATHSLAMALIAAAIAGLIAGPSGLKPLRTALFVGIVAASHGLLDTLTFGGGLGCALLWPFSYTRYWSPLRFIPIAPIGLAMFSRRGLTVLVVELILFAPFWLYAFWPRPSRSVAKAV